MQVVNRSAVAFQLVSAVLLAVAAAVIAAQFGVVGWMAGAVIFALGVLIIFRSPLRRWRAIRRPFPAGWRNWLLENIPFYRALGTDDRRRFERNVQMYLAEQRFEGVNGADPTRERKLAVAACAGMMLHGRPEWEMSFSRTVLFYPAVFDDEYLMEDTDASFDGMVHGQGPIIISVKAMEQDIAQPHSGHNVVLHELAHVLDYRGAFADGVPSLVDPQSEDAWTELVRREMNRIRTRRSLLRDYAAESPVEFFAVSVENFFERPGPLKRQHPELYDALSAMFNLDPLALYRQAGVTSVGS